MPAGGTYRIETWGASGADSSTYGEGGQGAILSSNILLQNNDLIKVIVGQVGLGNSDGGGGGGGTFVINASKSVLLLASGGGGGAGGYRETTINPHLQDGKDAVNEVNGTDAQTQGSGSFYTALGEGGSLGNGGTGGKSHRPGGGGAGFLSNGTIGVTEGGGNPGNPGLTFNQGFVGGTDELSSESRSGGFGGGGGAGLGGGGGGGFSGGGGGVWTGHGNSDWGHGGGGGGSYNSGTNQDNQAGANAGHGKVIITYIGN